MSFVMKSEMRNPISSSSPASGPTSPSVADRAVVALLTASLFLEPPSPHRLGDFGDLDLAVEATTGEALGKGNKCQVLRRPLYKGHKRGTTSGRQANKAGTVIVMLTFSTALRLRPVSRVTAPSTESVLT